MKNKVLIALRARDIATLWRRGLDLVLMPLRDEYRENPTLTKDCTGGSSRRFAQR